jgi:Phosphotransferase enzyme family
MSTNVEMVIRSELHQNDVAEELRQRLLEAVRPTITDLKSLPTRMPVADSTSKFLGTDQHGRPVAMVICSPSIAPDSVAQNLELKKMAWAALGSWSDVILAPFRTGTIDGLSYAIFPHCRSMSASRTVWTVQRAWIRPVVLSWLRGATATTVSDATEREREEGFVIPLEYLAGWGSMPAELRSAARVATQRLKDGLWEPRHCLMHGDLWKGNILVAPRSRGFRQFVLIDWGASIVRGYGMYDLLRVAASTKLRRYRLGREVKAHCQILGCEFVDARSHLLAALGHFGMNLGHYPFANYSASSLSILKQLSSLGG